VNRAFGRWAAGFVLVWLAYLLVHPGLAQGPRSLLLHPFTAQAIGPSPRGLPALWGLLLRNPGLAASVLLAVLGTAFALHALAIRRARTAGSLGSAGLPAVLVAVLLSASMPVFSGDVFAYLAIGEIADSGRNPYAVSVRSDRTLEARPFAPPTRHGSLYGPLATRTFQVVRREGDPLWTQVLAMRAVMGIALAASVWFVLGALRALRPDEGEIRAALIALAWSPLVLAEGIVAAHVDALILVLLAAGIFAIARGRATTGLAILAVTPSIKISCLFMAPALAAFAYHHHGGGRRGALAVGALGAWTAAAYGVWLLPDWGSPADPLRQVQHYAAGSAPWLLGVVARSLGSTQAVANWIMRAVFAAVLLHGVHRVDTRDRFLERLSRDWLAALLFFIPWVHPWYLLPAFAPVLVAGRPAHRRTLLLFSALLFLAHAVVPMIANRGWTPAVQLLVYAAGVLPASVVFLRAARRASGVPA